MFPSGLNSAHPRAVGRALGHRVRCAIGIAVEFATLGEVALFPTTTLVASAAETTQTTSRAGGAAYSQENATTALAPAHIAHVRESHGRRIAAAPRLTWRHAAPGAFHAGRPDVVPLRPSASSTPAAKSAPAPRDTRAPPTRLHVAGQPRRSVVTTFLLLSGPLAGRQRPR